MDKNMDTNDKTNNKFLMLIHRTSLNLMNCVVWKK